MGCKKATVSYTYTTVCAKICEKINNIDPIIDYLYEDNQLVGSMSLDTDLFYHKWTVYDKKNHILYNSGYGEYGGLIPSFTNGSTHGTLILGENNIDLYNILTNFFVLKNEIFIKYTVKNKITLYEYEKTKLYING